MRPNLPSYTSYDRFEKSDGKTDDENRRLLQHRPLLDWGSIRFGVQPYDAKGRMTRAQGDPSHVLILLCVHTTLPASLTTFSLKLTGK